MGDLNLFSIIVVFLLTSFMFDGKVEKKFKAISSRMMDLWDGKSSEDKDKKAQKGGGSVVSVSQPISRGGAPTHAPSRADYLNSPNAQTSSTQMMPAQEAPTQPVSPQNGQEQYSNQPLQPSPFSLGGGGGNFAAF